MANTDSIDVIGPASLPELAAAVAAAAGSTVRTDEGGTVGVALQPGVVALVHYDPVPGEDYPYFISVQDSDMEDVSTSERMAASRQLYEALVEQTDWGLRYASDDAFDFPVAQRPTVARAS